MTRNITLMKITYDVLDQDIMDVLLDASPSSNNPEVPDTTNQAEQNEAARAEKIALELAYQEYLAHVEGFYAVRG